MESMPSSSLTGWLVALSPSARQVLAKRRFEGIYPDDPQAALAGFASFMGHFGQAGRRTFPIRHDSPSLVLSLSQVTNSISFLFSLFGTGLVIQSFGLTYTLLSFPALLLLCTALVWLYPTIWVNAHAIDIAHE